jgi:penicillin-binding protein 1A
MKKTTGGGLPAEIWSRFMKVAHKGVPVVPLPPEPGGFFAGFSGGRPAPIAPTQVAAQPASTGQQSIDQWLADKLFGRR